MRKKENNLWKQVKIVAGLAIAFSVGYFLGHPAETQALALPETEMVAVEDTQIPTGKPETNADVTEENNTAEEVAVMDTVDSSEIVDSVGYVAAAPEVATVFVPVETGISSGEIVDTIVSAPEEIIDDSQNVADSDNQGEIVNDKDAEEEDKEDESDSNSETSDEDSSDKDADVDESDSKDENDDNTNNGESEIVPPTTSDSDNENQEVDTPEEPTPVGEVYYVTSEIFNGTNDVRVITEGFQKMSDGTEIKVSTVSCFVDYYEYTGEPRPEESTEDNTVVETVETVETVDSTVDEAVEVVEETLDNAEVEG